MAQVSFSKGESFFGIGNLRLQAQRFNQKSFFKYFAVSSFTPLSCILVNMFFGAR
jgi:hypothetical protein